MQRRQLAAFDIHTKCTSVATAPLRTARLASVSLQVNMPANTSAAYGAAHRELESACRFHHALAPELLLPLPCPHTAKIMAFGRSRWSQQ